MIVQLVTASGNRKGQTIPITMEKFIIGRADDCHLKPQSALISRYHCAILVGEDVVIRDLGSKNGVRLNGEKIAQEQQLNNGDHLIVGPLEFYIHIIPETNTSPLTAVNSSRTANRTEEGSSADIGAAQQTILLDHLRSINRDRIDESGSGILSPRKKIL